jgi:succinoglycan biosynthesis transport protein ExoP
VSDLNSELTTATIERQNAEASLTQVKRLLKMPNQVETASQVLRSELIQRFRENEAALEAREGEMTEKYGRLHPAMMQLRAEKQRLEQKVRVEINKIAQGLENELSVARDREAALKRDVEGVKDEASRQNMASVGLRLLQREVEANKLELDKFLSAFMQSNAWEDIRAQLRDVEIISPAAVPEHPSFPPRTTLIMIAFFGSTVVGALLAFGVEYLDRGFRSAVQIEMMSGLPVLAQVPVVTRNRKAASYGVEFPDSTYAAAICSIYSRLSLMHDSRPPQVVLVTSAGVGEGKSTTSLSLARQAAQAGLRVILIEADFRRPSIGRLSGVGSASGLGELLAGAAKREEVTKRDARSTADIIIAGGAAPDLAFSDPRWVKQLLDELRASYDLILIDSMPIFGIADANIFSAVVDATLMIVQWGSTPRSIFLYSIEKIAQSGGRIDGVVISKIDVKRHAVYDYGDLRY